MGTDGGRRAETLVAAWMRLRGWRVVARNWRGGGGEIDLVLVRGRTLVACEVKARGDGTWLAEPVRAAQAERMLRAVSAFLAAHPRLADLEVRLDLVTVHGRGPLRRVRHHAGGAAPPCLERW